LKTVFFVFGLGFSLTSATAQTQIRAKSEEAPYSITPSGNKPTMEIEADESRYALVIGRKRQTFTQFPHVS
jgi:hypothetical protein